MDTAKKHSFASVLSNFELKGYLAPFRVEADAPPLPSTPIQSYDRRDSWSSSRDSFYTLDEEPLPQEDDRFVTPRPGTKVSIHSPQPSNSSTIARGEDQIQRPEELELSNTSQVDPAARRLSIVSSNADFDLYQHPAEEQEDVITEQELRELEDEYTPKPRIKAKNLNAMFGESANGSIPSTSRRPQRRAPDFADIMMGDEQHHLVDRLFGEEDMPNQSYTKRDSYIPEVRKKIGWKATSSNNQQREADKRDFAQLIMGEDDRRLADKLFGGKELPGQSFDPTVTSKPRQSTKSSRPDIADLLMDDNDKLADKLFGGGEFAGQAFDRSAKSFSALPTQRTAATRATAINSSPLPSPTASKHQQRSSVSASSQSTASTSRPGIAASSITRPSISEFDSAPEWHSSKLAAVIAPVVPGPRSLSSHSPTTETLRPPQQHQPRTSTDSSVSSVTDVSEAISETTANSDAEFAYLGDSINASVDDFTESESGYSTPKHSHKPSASTMSEISAHDLSAPPPAPASAPDVHRYQEVQYPVRRSSLFARTASLDSAAPPPISLLRNEREIRAYGTPKAPSRFSSLKNALLRKQTLKRQDQDAAAIARARQQEQLAEQELLANSVRYERAMPRQTPFSSKDVADIFPSRRGSESDANFGLNKKKSRKGNVPIGLQVLREHTIAESMKSPVFSLPGSRGSGDSDAAHRYWAERAAEALGEDEDFRTPLGSAKRLSVLVEE